MPDQPRRRLRVVVSGMVQGVGFRFFASRCAEERALTGWVANRPDGTVEIEVQGTAGAVAAFLEQVRQGPRSARIASVKTEALQEKEEEGSFEVF